MTAAEYRNYLDGLMNAKKGENQEEKPQGDDL